MRIPCLRITLLCSLVSQRGSFNLPPRVVAGFGTTNVKRFSTIKSAFTNVNQRTKKLQELILDVKDIVLTPGMAGVGVTRTLQIVSALNRISLSFVTNRSEFLGPNNELSVPKALRKIFQEFGATYIKLGQFIASSPTLFPADYVKEFQSCLDSTPPVPYAAIRKIIEEDLKRPLSQVYSYVDPVPLASASIAQVHRATLLDGTDVVIKVRKPGVESTLQADLSFLLIASKIAELANPQFSALSLSNIVTDIRDSMLEELDFRKEIGNIENFRQFLQQHGIRDAIAPRPYLAASSKRVLTMDYLRGVPLVDLEGIRKFTVSPEDTLISALRTWAMTVAINDRFHADLHAGNLLVLSDGRIGFIDFGIVGKISNQFRKAIEDLFEALVQEDYRGVASALTRMGATHAEVNLDRFAAGLRDVARRVNALQPEITLGSDTYGQKSVEARLQADEKETTQLVLDIVAVAQDNGLRLPREFGLILKQALYFDRYQKLLAPSVDPLRDVRLREQFYSSQYPYQYGGAAPAVSSGPAAQVKRVVIDVEVEPER